MLTPALRLFKGRTTHVRFTPFERRFSYRIFLIDVDIDRLEDASKSSALFSVDRPNLFAFRRADHGARQAEDLRPWAEAEFAKTNILLDGGAIRLVTFARGLFYKFAPISLWFGYGPEGDLRGIIYEVNNTFGETHCYVARAGDTRMQHGCEKKFHVSPFWDVTGQYVFTLRPLGDTLDLVIDSVADGSRIHMANIKARQVPATSATLLKTAIARPFAAIAVTLAIHWQALWIWLKGAGYRSKPKQLPERTTLATNIQQDVTQDQAA